MPISQDPSTPYYPYMFGEDATRKDWIEALNHPDLIFTLAGALQDLLNDLEDANETRGEDGRHYQSVAYAYAALDRAMPEKTSPPLVEVVLRTHRVVPDVEAYIDGAERELYEEIFDMPEDLRHMIETQTAWGRTAANIDTEIIESADFLHGKDEN